MDEQRHEHVQDDLIKNEPEPILAEWMASPLQGIGLLEIIISPRKLQVKVLGTNGTGYERIIDPFRDHLIVNTHCIISHQMHSVHTEYVHTQNNLPYRQLLKFVFESLPSNIQVNQLNYHVIWDECRKNPADLAAFENFKQECINKISEALDTRINILANQPVKVGKFIIEYDGSDEGQDEIQVLLDNIDMIEPREIEIRSPRDQIEQSQLYMDQNVVHSAGWNTARNIVISDKFWMKPEPECWRNIGKLYITIDQLTDTNLERILENLFMSATFVSCTINLVIPIQQSWRSILPVGAVIIPEYEFEYERTLRGRFGADSDKIMIRRV